MPKSKKVNINDPAAWANLDWDKPTIPDALKKTDAQVNIARANRLKANDPKIKAKLSKSTQSSLKKPEVQQARAKAARKGGDTKANSAEYQQLMTAVNQKKALDPEFSKNVSKGIRQKLKDPAYQASRDAGNDKKKNNPEYKEKMAEVNRKKAENPEFSDNVRKGIAAKRLADPTAMRNGGSTQVKACTNNKGETFASRVQAAKAYGVDPRVMGKWIKKGKDGWCYL